MQKLTKAKLLKLAELLGMPQQDILDMAVTELYARVMEKEGSRLIPRENFMYDVQVGGKTVATIDEDALKGLPPAIISSMLEDGEPGGFALALMTAARNGHGFTLYGVNLPDDTNGGDNEETL